MDDIKFDYPLLTNVYSELRDLLSENIDLREENKRLLGYKEKYDKLLDDTLAFQSKNSANLLMMGLKLAESGGLDNKDA